MSRYRSSFGVTKNGLDGRSLRNIRNGSLNGELLHGSGPLTEYELSREIICGDCVMRPLESVRKYSVNPPVLRLAVRSSM